MVRWYDPKSAYGISSNHQVNFDRRSLAGANMPDIGILAMC
jgi:hypothetical protein